MARRWEVFEPGTAATPDQASLILDPDSVHFRDERIVDLFTNSVNMKIISIEYDDLVFLCDRILEIGTAVLKLNWHDGWRA